LQTGGQIALPTKYDVASVGDVMCHPFYWQLFGLMTQPPELIVDCGGHLGHFTMLADVCVRTRFPNASPSYLVLEAHPNLARRIHHNLIAYGLNREARVICGLLGNEAKGSATLWADESNLLSSASDKRPGARAIATEHVSLSELCGDQPVDVLKLDIEGAEYALLERIVPLLKRTRLLLVEFHDTGSKRHRDAVSSLNESGFAPVGVSCGHGNRWLAAFRRDNPI